MLVGLGEALRADDVMVRLDAFKQLPTIAVALGRQRATSELLPFLQEALLTEDDEVLVVLAEQLSPPFVQAHLEAGEATLHTILAMLETLAGAEESLVRNAAVANLQAFVATDKSAEPVIEGIFSRLAGGDWFTTKTSACALLPHFASANSASFAGMVDVVVKFAVDDESPMVRRAALPALTGTLERLESADAAIVRSVMRALEQGARDAQDSVRLLSVPLLSKLVRWNAALASQLLPTLAEDDSWRVRFMVATHLHELIPSLSAEGEPLFGRLLDDPEAEVRAAMAKHFADVCIEGLKAVSERSLRHLRRVCQDTSPAVRQAVATQLNALSDLAGPQVTRRDLLPLLEQLMRDDDSTVRLNVVRRLDAINRVIGVKELTGTLMPAIETLAGDKQWRVRHACVSYFPVLAGHLGPDVPHLVPLLMRWLTDTVHAVRAEAVDCVVHVARAFGAPWARAHLLGALTDTIVGSKDEGGETDEGKRLGYLKRVSLGHCVRRLMQEVPAMFADDAGDRLLIRLLADPVGNVRMTVHVDAYERLLQQGQVPMEQDQDVVEIRRRMATQSYLQVTVLADE